jgi:hypothetical protein
MAETGMSVLSGDYSLFQKHSSVIMGFPSGAKARIFPAQDGMAKAMPLQNTIYETCSRTSNAKDYLIFRETW